MRLLDAETKEVDPAPGGTVQSRVSIQPQFKPQILLSKDVLPMEAVTFYESLRQYFELSNMALAPALQQQMLAKTCFSSEINTSLDKVLGADDTLKEIIEKVTDIHLRYFPLLLRRLNYYEKKQKTGQTRQTHWH